ncbi:hypothetical protein [Guggenheimella bovis]
MNHELKEKSLRLSETAREYALDFNRRFDYSEASIRDLEAILDYYSKDMKESHPTENQVWSMAMVFGSYLGEVLLRNGLEERGFYWNVLEDSPIPVLQNEKGAFLTPVDKVFNRFVNGSVENVISFYEVMKEATK